MNVLLIDDHPMTIAGFTESLQKESFSEFPPVFTNALNCEQAYYAIYKAFESNKHFARIYFKNLIYKFRIRMMMTHLVASNHFANFR